MTRKDYILIAAALQKARPTIANFTTHSAVGNNTFTDMISHDAAYAAWTRAAESVCDTLNTDNPRLDRGRFYAACEA